MERFAERTIESRLNIIFVPMTSAGDSRVCRNDGARRNDAVGGGIRRLVLPVGWAHPTVPYVYHGISHADSYTKRSRTVRFGFMGTDHEARVDFDRLRRERVEKTQKAMANTDIDALMLFDMNNVRYVTSTWLGEWARDKLARYSIMPREGSPLLFDFGSAVAAKKESCPWIADHIYPTSSWMRNSVPYGAKFQDEFMQFLVSVLKDHGVRHAKIGIDLMDMRILEGLQNAGFTLVDGQEIMLDARMVKTDDELDLLEGAASMVDAAYSTVVRSLRAGVRENDLVAIVNNELYRMGSEEVEAVNSISGARSSPHPHNFTDRMIRPGEPVFLDIVQSFMGYRTCYYRTFHVGKASPAMHDAYKQTYDWLYASIDKVKPGNTTADVASVWPTAESLGFESEAAAFGLQFGHGIGLSVWEKPVLSRRISMEEPIVLEENMVFALETYCPAKDGTGAARIEEECIVTKNGCRVITRYPCEELIEVQP